LPHPSLGWKSSIFFVIGSLLVTGVCLFYLLTSGQTFLLNSNPNSYTIPLAKLENTHAPLCQPKQRSFQAGIAYPRWEKTGYGQIDTTWQSGLSTMQSKTAACWVELPLLFHQSSLFSTDIAPGSATASLSSFTYGVYFAHSLGLHIFVDPLIQAGGSQSWAGAIKFSTLEQEQEWFANYWQAIKPYVAVAAKANVEQFAIGNELEWLQQNAPDDLWNTLISQFHNVFPGMLTYNINWTSLKDMPPTWMHNTALKTIGVSGYIPLTTTPDPIALTAIPALWKQTVQADLDAYAQKLGEPIFLSELGYRNRSDAYYNPWMSLRSAQPDPQLQAALFDAALSSLLSDSNILGVFLWGWNNVGDFSLQEKPAAQVVHNHYLSL
jgi:hypothetical protein